MSGRCHAVLLSGKMRFVKTEIGILWRVKLATQKITQFQQLLPIEKKRKEKRNVSQTRATVTASVLLTAENGNQLLPYLASLTQTAIIGNPTKPTLQQY